MVQPKLTRVEKSKFTQTTQESCATTLEVLHFMRHINLLTYLLTLLTHMITLLLRLADLYYTNVIKTCEYISNT